jgi:hypothetical protein
MKKSLSVLAAWLLLWPLAFAQDAATYDEGIAKFRSGNYASVIDLFSGAIANPERNKRYDEDLYFYRGQSYYFTNEPDKALADLDKCLELNHYNKGQVHWFKARCYDKQGKPAEAEYQEALTSAERNRKLTAQILADRAQYYSRHGNREAASKDLAAAKELDPTQTAVVRNEPAGNTADKKTTQVIVKKNTNASSQTPVKKQPATTQVAKNQVVTTPPVEPAAQPAEEVSSSASLVASLASAYKDEKRYALVIGNGTYPKTMGTLKNPVNDATDVTTELRKSNFEVQLLTNATYVQMREAMRKFQQNLTNGPKDQTVGLFYYAGHGVQFQDENYLVPIDANVEFEDDIVRMCFPVQKMVLANMEQTNSRMNIVILDACRNNPFPATTRSIGGGLGEMKRARGSFIAYATAPGSVAADGGGRNGLYTQELLKAIRKQGLTIEQVFKEVRMNVLHLSGDRQFTWDSSNIIGEFYFKIPQ